MAEALPTASLILDLLGRIRHASSAAVELLGLSRDELFGMYLSDLAADGDRVVAARRDGRGAERAVRPGGRVHRARGRTATG